MKDTVKTIISQQSGHDIRDDCKINFLGLDDIDFDEIAEELSISFECNIKSHEIQSFKSLDQFIELLNKKCKFVKKS